MAGKVRVGVVGIGFMGKMHFGVYKANPKSQVVAIADVDAKKLSGDWSAIAGNIGDGSAKSVDLAGIRKYRDAMDLINDPEVDLVDITLPTYLHARYTLAALAAGKHVISEKPICDNLADAKKVVAAAKKARGRFMVAHCIRFWPEYAWTKEHVVEKGEFGKVLSASFRRLSGTPIWSWTNWLMDAKKSGAAAVDLHIHDVDYVRYLFGDPKAVWAQGAVNAVSKGGGVDHIVAQYRYPGVGQVTAEGGWAMAPGFGFEMSFILVCEKATVVYNCTKTPAFAVHLRNGKTLTPKVAAGDGYSLELDYFLDCIQKKRNPKVVTGTEALKSLALALAEVRSLKAGGKQVRA
ncbi:MAG TPA: Gfo/Idh/MocA family oxidoreductase [Planctomycetota bacterium]|nr:Gfo/Idh/MocA family oxidoreductase [Planctomycetota bacterium]